MSFWLLHAMISNTCNPNPSQLSYSHTLKKKCSAGFFASDQKWLKVRGFTLGFPKCTVFLNRAAMWGNLFAMSITQGTDSIAITISQISFKKNAIVNQTQFKP